MVAFSAGVSVYKLATLLTIATLAPAVPAAEEPALPPPGAELAREAPNRKIRFSAGVLAPTHRDVKGFDPGPAAMVAADFPTRADNLFVEAGIGVARLTGRETYDSGLADLTMLVVPVTVALKLMIPVGPVDAHLLTGVGYYYVDATARVGGISEATTDLNSALGVQYGVGVAGRLSSGMRLGVDMRYHSASTLELYGDGSKLNSVQASAFVARRF